MNYQQFGNLSGARASWVFFTSVSLSWIISLLRKKRFEFWEIKNYQHSLSRLQCHEKVCRIKANNHKINNWRRLSFHECLFSFHLAIIMPGPWKAWTALNFIDLQSGLLCYIVDRGSFIILRLRIAFHEPFFVRVESELTMGVKRWIMYSLLRLPHSVIVTRDYSAQFIETFAFAPSNRFIRARKCGEVTTLATGH